MSWPRQGFQKTLEIPKFEFASWISWVWGCACQGRLGGCPPPKSFIPLFCSPAVGKVSKPRRGNPLVEFVVEVWIGRKKEIGKDDWEPPA